MTKTFHLAIGLLLAQAAFASTNEMNIFEQSQTTHYQQLQDYFNVGSQPSESAVKGWWSGRCYRVESPDTAIGTLLVAEPVTVESIPGQNENDGPLFPPVPPVMSTHFNFALVNFSNDQSADVYDELSESEIDSTKGFIDSDYFKMLSYTLENSSLLSTVSDKGSRYEMRQYQSYFIVRLVALKEIGKYKPGDVAASCYFFKKVHD